MSKVKDNHRPAVGRKRFLKMAGMTATLATRYAGHVVANSFRNTEQRDKARERLNAQAGEHLAETLGELKGAVMKIGQIASQASDFFPEEISRQLKRLQKEAPAIPFAIIVDLIESELGQPVDKLFSQLDPEPYAAASIGQVHRGVLPDGREVVVKVQYPGVAESCDSDLRQIKVALRAGRLIKVKKKVLDELFVEIRDRLLEELDYVQEAENMELFRQFFAADRHIVIPATVPDMCTRQVLTMILEEGDHLEEVGRQYPQAKRNQLAIDLFEFMTRSVFELKAVHADPNPGNFAYRSDGSLVIYDFGCIKRLGNDVVEAYYGTVRAALQGDWEAVDRGLQQLGVRTPGSRAVEADFYEGWKPIVLRALLDDSPFNFAASTIHIDAMAKLPEAMARLDQFQPPVKTAYLDRMISGHYWTLVTLGADVGFRPLLIAQLDNYQAAHSQPGG